MVSSGAPARDFTVSSELWHLPTHTSSPDVPEGRFLASPTCEDLVAFLPSCEPWLCPLRGLNPSPWGGGLLLGQQGSVSAVGWWLLLYLLSLHSLEFSLTLTSQVPITPIRY